MTPQEWNAATQADQAELVAAAKVRYVPGQSAEMFTKRVAEKLLKIPEPIWNAMSDEAQTWNNVTIERMEENTQLEKKKLPTLPLPKLLDVSMFVLPEENQVDQEPGETQAQEPDVSESIEEKLLDTAGERVQNGHDVVDDAAVPGEPENDMTTSVKRRKLGENKATKVRAKVAKTERRKKATAGKAVTNARSRVPSEEAVAAAEKFARVVKSKDLAKADKDAAIKAALKDGATYGQIAGVLGVTSQTVWARINRHA